MLGLPIPYIFVADLPPKDDDDSDDEARLEIVDGTQRIRTLDRFINNELRLCGLDKLKKLNDFKFKDLPLARRRRFNRATIRMIVLTDKADEEIRRDVFERINTGSVELNDMEKRRGISPGPFVNLLEELARDPKFRQLSPLSETLVNKREPEEFVLRFFAYLNNYNNFDRRVNLFLNEYLEKYNHTEIDTEAMRKENLFSGNIDGKRIRITADEYGFSHTTDYAKTAHGSDLVTIKTNRNLLAHGFKSFAEVGRDKTADELLEIKSKVIRYLRQILQNIEQYLVNKDYLDLSIRGNP